MVIIFWFPCIFNLLVPNQKRSFSGNASHSRKAPLLKHELEKRYNGHKCVWFTHIVTLGGYLHRSHREKLALPREAYSPSAWWSTMYVNRRGHDVSKPYTTDTNLMGNALGSNHHDLPQLLNLLIVVDWINGSDIPTHQIHVRLEHSRQFLGGICLDH